MRSSRGESRTWSGRALLDDDAVVHEHDPARNIAREADLVRHDDHRHPLGGELAHHVEHLLDQLRVERRGDLVEEHHMRVHRQRPGDRHPLLLAAGEPIGELVELVGEPDPVQQRLGLRSRLLVAALEHLRLREADVRDRRLVLEQVELLEDDPDPPADEVDVARALGALLVGDLAALEKDVSLLRRLEQVDAAQQGRLPRPARPEHADHLAPLELHVDAAQDLELAKALVDVVQPQDRTAVYGRGGLAVRLHA